MTPECIVIPPGTFLRGGGVDDKFCNATELPRQEMVIRKPFRMSVCPVTSRQWQAWPEADRGQPYSSLPVTRVSWHQAVAFCAWLSQESGKCWRLPTETEWEYACRAGTNTPFSTGDMIDVSQANYLYAEDGSRVGVAGLLPVGSFAPNAFGLHDLHGNVCEWTSDIWRDSYARDAAVDDDRRVIRGGAWDYLPRMLRSSWRDGLDVFTRRDNLGFRVVTEDT